VSLPLADRLALVDPVTSEARYLPPFEDDVLRNPSDTTMLDGQLAVVGTDSGRIIIIDPDSGEPSVARDFDWRNAWAIEKMGDSHVLVASDAGGKGRLWKIDRNLSLVASAEIGPGPSGLIVSRRVVWTISDGISKSYPKTSISKINPKSMEVSTFALPGGPEGMVMTHTGDLVVSLFRRGEIVKIDGRGDVVSRLSNVSHPWGVARFGKRVVVVEQERTDERSRLLVLQPRSMTERSRIPLSGACPDPRDIVTIANLAVIACAALPGVAIVDLAEGKVVDTIRMVPPQGESFAEFEQPRGLTAVVLRTNEE
jgi:hypothetical protein